MEASPLSVHSLSLLHHRPLSTKLTVVSRQKSLISLNPNPHPHLTSSTYYNSTSSSLFKIPINTIPSFQSRKNRSLLITAAFEKFTERAIKSVVFSQREAKSLGKGMVFPQHLLLGLIAESGSDSDGFLGSGITIEIARDAVRSIWKVGEGDDNDRNNLVTSASDLPFSISTKRVFEAAVEYSRTMGYNFIAPEHIAVGLFTVDDGSAGRVLKRLGANINDLAAVAITRLQGELAKDGREPSAAAKRGREKLSTSKGTIIRSPMKTKDKSALARFCVDLTARAGDGLIDPIIGRDTEIQRIIQILCRRTKNNPILLGEAGVGKTAIAEGLAINIAQGNIPVFLLTKRVMSLDIGLLIAGARERGELEARVTRLIKDVKKSGNIILFIDEVHTLIGTGTVGRGNKSGLDIANLLKPSLGRGELQCIASTTTDEYRTYFEKDKALARRFQPVMINEPSQDDAVRILLGLREKYEDHHKCRYTLEALNAAVHLSARYIPDRHLPDKAIDLIDEAGSKARMEFYKRRKEQQTCILSKSPDKYWQEIRTVQAMHEVVITLLLLAIDQISLPSPHYIGGPFLDPRLFQWTWNSCLRILYSRNYFQHHSLALASILNEDDGASSIENDHKLPDKSLPKSDEPVVVGPDEIAAVAAVWSGIPVQKLTADERMLLVGLDELLKKRVVGQDEAVSAICRAVRRSRVGLKDPKRPIATMLFCGPTGVGKTELTKALAACYFGSEAAMVRLDMSEYMERHTVSKLIGSPPGYVGYGAGSTLTEAIRKRPFTVLLLDEIEKAHPDIFNILLQIFEDGHLTDSQGRRVSFKNALVVMTSNVGSTAIAKGRHRRIDPFFAEDDVESTSYAGLKSLVMEELKGYFRPELLNRIDEVVVFRALEKAQMLEILNMMLLEVRGRLVSMGIGLEVSEAAMDLICKQGYDRSYGARPLRRAVTQLVEDRLSDAYLTGLLKPGDTAIIDLDDSGNPVVRNQSSQNIELSDTFL